MYDHIAAKLARDEIIILDGGTGTDIQRRGAPMNGDTWCAEVNLTHPDIVQAVHEDYWMKSNTWYPNSRLKWGGHG